MTAYAHASDPWQFGCFNLQMETGSSLEAKRVQRTVEESLEHYLGPRLLQLISPIIDLIAKSQTEETPIPRETARTAIAFATLLPRMAPIPEVSSDPDRGNFLRLECAVWQDVLCQREQFGATVIRRLVRRVQQGSWN